MSLRAIKHQLTCPFELTSSSFLIGRRRILVIPRNHLVRFIVWQIFSIWIFDSIFRYVRHNTSTTCCYAASTYEIWPIFDIHFQFETHWFKCVLPLLERRNLWRKALFDRAMSHTYLIKSVYTLALETKFCMLLRLRSIEWKIKVKRNNVVNLTFLNNFMVWLSSRLKR